MISKIISFILRLLTPLVLIAILISFTLLLLEMREARKPVVDNRYDGRGINMGTVTPVTVEDWYSYYGGGEGMDQVISQSGNALRISTGAAGGWFGARAPVSVSDMSSSSIRFAVRADDWSQLDRALLLLASDDEFQHYFGINLKNYFSNPVNDEWIEVVLPRSSFEVIEGTPDWSAIQEIALRVVPNPGAATRMWFDEFAFVSRTIQSAVVTFAFDDGFKSAATAAEIMKEYDFSATVHVILDFIGADGYLSQDDIDSLAELSWDISGHGATNLTDLSFPDADTELAKMYAYLRENEYQGGSHYAYPNGGYNESVRSQALEYFTSARTIDGFPQPQSYVYPASVNAVTVSSSTSPIEIINLIDTAAEQGQWLVLVWHDLVEDVPESDIEYRIEDFSRIVSYIAANDITVLPYSQAFDIVTGVDVVEP